jgi:hypothetical protein
MELFLVGQYKKGKFPNVIWEFQGIFSSKENATSACRNENYFISSVTLDENLPDETILPSNIKYFKK